MELTTVGTAALVILLTGLALYATRQWQKADKARREAEQRYQDANYDASAAELDRRMAENHARSVQRRYEKVTMKLNERDKYVSMLEDIARGKDFTIRKLQYENKKWADVNFGEDVPSWQPLIGIMEELGELAHAHLKGAQGIRTDEDHRAAQEDALGDVFEYMLHYASQEGINLHKTIVSVHNEVMNRDWNANEVDGSVDTD